MVWRVHVHVVVPPGVGGARLGADVWIGWDGAAAGLGLVLGCVVDARR